MLNDDERSTLTKAAEILRREAHNTANYPSLSEIDKCVQRVYTADASSAAGHIGYVLAAKEVPNGTE